MNVKANRMTGLILGVVLLCGAVLGCREKKTPEIRKTLEVTRGTLAIEIVAAGNVQPQNRLELKPPINGRCEELLVREGDKVRKGQIVAWLSSSERAALLDAARALGTNETTYWETVYKPTALIAPIDGEVIVRAVEPGQQVNSGSSVIVLSDRLIVRARFDETDIGKVAVGAPARIVLDAYPELVVSSRVDHISFESTIVNNVTVYEVEVVPDRLPSEFRAGMSAEVTVVAERHEHVILIPDEAIVREGETASVRLVRAGRPEGDLQPVELGASDGQQVEIVKGLKEGDTILLQRGTYDPSMGEGPKDSPFMPTRRGRGGRR